MDVSDRPESKDGRLHLAVVTCTEVLGDDVLKWGPPQIAYLWWVPDLAPKNGLMYRRYTRGGCVGGSGKV